MPRAQSRKRFDNMAEVLEQLGGIEPYRVRLDPPPGTATEGDLLAVSERTGRLYELVDGTLVEKVMGEEESFVGGELLWLLRNYLAQHDRGYLTPADGGK